MSLLAGLLIAAVFLIALGVLVLLLVLFSIRAEDRHMSLTSAPRCRADAVTRRMLGVCVRHSRPSAGCHYQSARR